MNTRHLLSSSILATVLATVLSCAGIARAQTFSLNWNPRSGDVWVDARLGDVNAYGMRYRDPFIDELVRYHDAPRGLVTELLVTRRWAPGDVYYACVIARIIGRRCDYVADYWQAHHAQGWGAVARQLGIRPGSAEFHRLKRGFVPTYDRWARPIPLDAELQRVYPNRGKGKAVATGVVSPNNHPQGKAAKGPAGKGQDKGNNKQNGNDKSKHNNGAQGHGKHGR
jgi:hypothetical protein